MVRNIIDLIKTAFLDFYHRNQDLQLYSLGKIISLRIFYLNYNVAVFANNVAVFRRNQ